MKIMKCLSLAAMVILLVSCNNNGAAQKPIKTELDSVSYAIGMDVAKNVKASFDDFDNELFIQGFTNVLDSTDILIDATIAQQVVRTYFQNKPDGLPGNDDTGTMSAWLVYSMMGIYPISPGSPNYAITTPMFDKITIQLDSKYYKKKELVIMREGKNKGKINKILLDKNKHKSYFISHDKLVNGNNLRVILNNHF